MSAPTGPGSYPDPVGLVSAGFPRDVVEVQVYGLRGLGDRAWLSLARARDMPVVTANRRWIPLAPSLGVRVHAIRQTRERAEGHEEDR